MKNILIALLLIVTIGTASVPASVQAATRAELLQQIEYLTTLISLLQKQLELKRQQENAFKMNDEQAFWSKQLQGMLREKPDVKGYLNVQVVKATSMQLSGSIIPHSSCVGTEHMEIILDYGNGSSKSFTLEECKTVFFDETVVYTPSLIPVYPTLKLKWEDWNNQVWQYSEMSRYMINLSNPLNPTITNLGVDGEKG